jgi:hypothetical protein
VSGLETANQNERLLAIFNSIKDPAILPVFLIKILEKYDDETSKMLVAEALGELGDKQAIPALLNLTENIGTGVLKRKAAITAIEALAKLGNFDKADMLASFLDTTSRSITVQALQSVAGQGAVAALSKVLEEGTKNQTLEAADSLFYLGVKEAIDALVRCAANKKRWNEPDLDTYRASYYVQRLLTIIVKLTGASEELYNSALKASDITKWWKQAQSNYQSGICYRSGQPLYIPNIFGQIDNPSNALFILRELRIITGAKFEYDPNDRNYDYATLKQQVQAWWEREGHNFERGALYKYGYKQDITKI